MPGRNLSRDHARTPMQWSNDINSGFTYGKPWLRLNKNYARENVQAQRHDPYSMLSLYKRLIAFRQKEPSMLFGSYSPVFSDRQMLAYSRKANGEAEFLVLLNLSHRPCYFNPAHMTLKGTVEIATTPDIEGLRVENNVSLSGDEALIIRLE
jgi:alpha-glucosidase